MANAELNGLEKGDAQPADLASKTIADEANKSVITNGNIFHFSPLSLEDVRQLHADFAAERNWGQFHTPRNLMMALTGEVGEVAELFQWRSDKECQVGLPYWTPEERANLGEELSDVLIYLVRLSDRCGIDLAKAVQDKMKKNAKKYPVEKAFGSSKKYNQF